MDIRAVNNKGETVLHSAYKGTSPRVATETLDLITYLVQAGVEIYALTTDDRTVLHEALLNGHSLGVMILLQEIRNASTCLGNYSFSPDQSGNTALHIAIMTGFVNAAERLIDIGAYISAVNNDGDTTIYAAVHKAIVKHGKIPGYTQLVKQVLLGNEISSEVFGGPQHDELSKIGYLRIIEKLRCLRETDINRRNCRGLAAIDLTNDGTWEAAVSLMEDARIMPEWRRIKKLAR